MSYAKQGCCHCNNPRIPVVACNRFWSCWGQKHTHYMCKCGRAFVVIGE